METFLRAGEGLEGVLFFVQLCLDSYKSIKYSLMEYYLN